MGLFSNKKKYTVNLTVQKLFEKEQIPDSARQGIIKGIMGNGNILDNMLEEMAGSMGVRANSALSWAKKNDYYFGIPTSTVKSNVDARTVVMSVIANNEGQEITPVYYTMAPMNSFHYAWTWLVNTHGYNAQTNELVGLFASTGFRCYLKDMVATYTKASYDFMVETNDLGMVEQLGPPPNSGYTPSNPFTSLAGIGAFNKEPLYEVSSVAVEDYVTITYEFEHAPGQFTVRGLTLPLTAVDLTTDFHQVRYKKADGKTGFFTYQQGSGTYPIIDQVFNLDFNDLGTYYPWVYFHVNEQQVSRMPDNKAYTDSKRICNYMGVDYDMLDEKVHEDPNIDDVAQSMLFFALNPGEKDPACVEYLFKHFNVLYENGNSKPPGTKANDLEEKFFAYTTSPSQVQAIRDKFFSMNFQFSGIAKQRKPGSIGKKGTYKSEYAVVGQNDQSFLTNDAFGVGARAVTGGQPAWIYRHQVTDTMFDEVAVYGLRADFNIHRKKGFGAGATDAGMLIPIDRAIMRTVSLRSKEQVLCTGMTFLVSTVIITTTPWYASGPFKIIMLVVALVITIFTAGAAWQSIVAAAALGTVALAITILSLIISSLVIQFGVKLFVKKFGPQVAIIAAVAAMAVGAYGASSNATWGETLISIGTNLATQANSAYQDIVSDIMKDIADFELYAKGEFDSLQDRKEQLGLSGQNVGLEPLEMVYRVPDIRIGEAPNDLYNRTVHSGNIGVTSYDLVEFYVDTKLTLPTLADNHQEEEDDGMAI